MLSRRIILLSILLFGISFNSYSQNVKHIPLLGKEMVYASEANKLIILGKEPGEFMNKRIYEVNPFTGKKEEKAVLHNGAIKLKISMDESLLYFRYLDQDTAIMALSLPSYELHHIINLGENEDNLPYFAADISPLPNDPNRIAVIKEVDDFPNDAQLVIYDHIVPRPNFYPLTHYQIDELVAHSPGNAVYGYNTDTSSKDLFQFTYDAEGFHDFGKEFLFSNIGDGILSRGNRLYTSTSKIISVEQDSVEFIMDRGYFFWTRMHWPDEVNGNVYGFFVPLSGPGILVLDGTHLNQLDFIPVPASPNLSYNYVTPLWQGYSCAYLASEDLVVVLDCPEESNAPMLDASLQSTQYVCEPDELVIHPPTGNDFIFDVDGAIKDSLVITEDGKYSYRLLSTEGCLTAPSEEFEVFFVPTPDKPSISALTETGYYTTVGIDDTLVSCTNSYSYLRGVSDSFDPDFDVFWSTGQTDKYLATMHVGKISARYVNEYGCMSSPSNELLIEEKSGDAPDLPFIESEFSANNLGHDCSGAFSSDFSGPSGFHSYHWEGGGFGQGNDINYTVLGFLPGIREISLQVMNEAGCWSEAAIGYVQIQGAKPAPVLSANGNNLSAPSALFYTWYRDGEVIPDANGQVYVVSGSGAYRVRLYDGECWGSFSNEIVFP